MAKGDAYYLRHDNDAFSDPKIIKLRMLHGFEAYALYWRILEMMFDEPGHTLAYSETAFNAIAFDTRTTLDVEEVVETGIEIGLFDVDEEDDGFFSPSLNRRMEDVKAFKQLQAEKGRKSGEARRRKARERTVFEPQGSDSRTELNHGSTTVEPVLNRTEPREEKRREEKNRDEKIHIVEKQASQPPLPYKEVIECLNSNAGTNYRHTTKSHQRLIKARLNEGFEVTDFETVILKKTAEWKGGDMEKFLRPETLFGTKFESYLNQQDGKQTIKTDTDYDYYAQNPDVENPLDWLS